MNSPGQTETRVIIPATTQTRQETGVGWFELSFDSREATARVTGFAGRGRALSTLEARIYPGGRVTGSISNDDGSVVIELRGRQSQPGAVGIEGSIDGQPFTISGAPGEAPYVEAARFDAQQDLLRPWRGLSSSLEVLAEALSEPASKAGPPLHIGGCQACLTVGAIVVQSAQECVDGSAGACSTLIDSYSIFQAGCDPPPCH
jgi:hypothetical protein